MSVAVVVVQLRHLVDLDRSLWRMFDMNVDNVGAEHSTLAIAVGQRQRVRRVDLSLAVATGRLLVLLVSCLNWHLAEFSSEVGGALTLVSGAALTAIYTWQVTHHYSEVGCCQSVCGVAILTDDGCGVSLLTVVVTSASDAG